MNASSNCTPDFPGYDEKLCETMRYTEITYQCLFLAIGVPTNCLKLLDDLGQFTKHRCWSQITQTSKRKDAGKLGRRKPIFRRPETPNRLFLFAIHLTISNLVILLFYCSMKTVWLVTFFWYGNAELCKFYKFISVFAYSLWSYIIVAIVVDMWLSVRSPFRNLYQGKQRVKIFLTLAYGFAFVFSVPQWVVSGLVEIPKDFLELYGHREKRYQCVNLYAASQNFARIYQAFHALTVFYIPLLIILSLFLAIGWSLFRKRKYEKILGIRTHLRFNSPAPSYHAISGCEFTETSASTHKSEKSSQFLQVQPNHSNLNLDSMSDIGECSRSGSAIGTTEQRRKHSIISAPKKKLIGKTAKIITAFILCWLPYQTVTTWRFLCEILTGNDYQTVCPAASCKLEWLEGLMIFSACLNPFLYRFNKSVLAGTDEEREEGRGRKITRFLRISTSATTSVGADEQKRMVRQFSMRLRAKSDTKENKDTREEVRRNGLFPLITQDPSTTLPAETIPRGYTM